MSFIDTIKERAKKDIKTIVLPEAEDVRILQATEQVINEGFARIILIGNEEAINKLAKENNVNIEGAKIVNPEIDEKHDEYVELYTI